MQVNASWWELVHLVYKCLLIHYLDLKPVIIIHVYILLNLLIWQNVPSSCHFTKPWTKSIIKDITDNQKSIDYYEWAHHVPMFLLFNILAYWWYHITAKHIAWVYLLRYMQEERGNRSICSMSHETIEFEFWYSIASNKINNKND